MALWCFFSTVVEHLYENGLTDSPIVSFLKVTEIPAELCHGIQGILNLDEDPILPDK